MFCTNMSFRHGFFFFFPQSSMSITNCLSRSFKRFRNHHLLLDLISSGSVSSRNGIYLLLLHLAIFSFIDKVF